jgi:hypothetical protein
MSADAIGQHLDDICVETSSDMFQKNIVSIFNFELIKEQLKTKQ